ncbi:MAG: hypothetical protein PHQ18_04240 [Patescibacteria group bacterium]|nr:hypothetical protein [Patescibacteria group bacterium]
MKFSWKNFKQTIFVSVLSSLFLFSFVSASTGSAVWNEGGMAVDVRDNGQDVLKIVSDNNGGSIVLWEAGSVLSVQRFDSNGNKKWESPYVGVTLNSLGGIPDMVSDGNGGAYISWFEVHSDNVNHTEVYAQHIDAGGNKKWDGFAGRMIAGIRPSQENNGHTDTSLYEAERSNLILTPDSTGGVFVAWRQSKRSVEGVPFEDISNIRNIYLQHLTSDGVELLVEDGMPVAPFSTRQEIPKIVSDGEGGVFVAWNDDRNAGSTSGESINTDIYAQHISQSGSKMWGSTGLQVTSGSSKQVLNDIVYGGSGGVILSWLDYSNGVSKPQIFVQLLNSSGTKFWSDNGTKVVGATSPFYTIRLISDGNAGAFVSWDTGAMTSATNHRVYVQHINMNGQSTWGNGVRSSNSEVESSMNSIVSDGNAGVYIFWKQGLKLYVQHISSVGQRTWTEDLFLARSAGYFTAIKNYVAWSDERKALGNANVYANNIMDVYMQKYTDNTVVENNSVENIDNVENTNSNTSCPLDFEKAYQYSGSKTVYYITKDCTKRGFSDPATFFSYFSSWSDVLSTNKAKLDSISNDKKFVMPKGPKYDPKYGALVKTVGDPKVYLLLNNNKYWITSEVVFNSLNYKWDWIESVDESLLSKYNTQSEITDTSKHPNYTLIKYSSSPKVYRLESDQNDSGKQVKRHIPNEKIFAQLNFRFDRVVTVPSTEIYSDGPELK